MNTYMGLYFIVSAYVWIVLLAAVGAGELDADTDLSDVRLGGLMFLSGLFWPVALAFLLYRHVKG